MRLARLLPALEWLPTYGRRQLESDLLAAVIVTVMLIASLAYAMRWPAAAYVGLYASMAPLWPTPCSDRAGCWPWDRWPSSR